MYCCPPALHSFAITVLSFEFQVSGILLTRLVGRSQSTCGPAVDVAVHRHFDAINVTLTYIALMEMKIDVSWNETGMRCLLTLKKIKGKL